jgi:NodT family efflux transporter outer membrane factor (OMF) lipoprotein
LTQLRISDFKSAVLLACFCISGIILSGCMVGPDYVKPSVTLTPLHNAQTMEAALKSKPAAPLDKWWIGFHDDHLTRIIERVIAQNLDIQAAKERVIQARSAAKAAGARLLPTIDTSAQAVSERLSLESPIGGIGRSLPDFKRQGELYDVGIGASWEVDLFGGQRRAAEAAQAEAEAAEALQAGTRISVAAEAADAYFQIRSAQARLQIASARIETETRLLELTRLRRSEGIGTDREVHQAEAILAEAQALVPIIRIELETQLNRLDVLMGAQPGTYANELNQIVSLPDIPAASPDTSDLLRRRPDVIAAERKLAAATARIGAAKAEYYPKLSLSGLLGYEAIETSHLFRSDTYQPLAIAGLRWRIFDFGRIDAEVERADAATREALLVYRQTILRAAEDVENACAILVQTEIRANDLARQTDALTKARDESQAAYRAGLLAFTDVLQTERQLLIAENELPKTRADVARAAVGLFRSLGGGW